MATLCPNHGSQCCRVAFISCSSRQVSPPSSEISPSQVNESGVMSTIDLRIGRPSCWVPSCAMRSPSARPVSRQKPADLGANQWTRQASRLESYARTVVPKPRSGDPHRSWTMRPSEVAFARELMPFAGLLVVLVVVDVPRADEPSVQIGVVAEVGVRPVGLEESKHCVVHAIQPGRWDGSVLERLCAGAVGGAA